jgi:hypothetical protein
MKADIIVVYEIDGVKHGLVFDIKATENWPSFRGNWIRNYTWQNKHYLEGFRAWCLERDIEPPDKMWYLIQESSPPHLLHIWALSVEDLDYLTPQYDDATARCQAWIDDGKPRKGFCDQQIVNRYGNEV